MTKARLSYPKHVYEKNAEIYKVLGHPTRLEILNMIKDHEVAVEDMIKVLRLRKANVSQHLAILRQCRFVTARRQGLNIYYKIVDRRLVEPCKIFKDL